MFGVWRLILALFIFLTFSFLHIHKQTLTHPFCFVFIFLLLLSLCLSSLLVFNGIHVREWMAGKTKSVFPLLLLSASLVHSLLIHSFFFSIFPFIFFINSLLCECIIKTLSHFVEFSHFFGIFFYYCYNTKFLLVLVKDFWLKFPKMTYLWLPPTFLLAQQPIILIFHFTEFSFLFVLFLDQQQYFQ